MGVRHDDVTKKVEMVGANCAKEHARSTLVGKALATSEHGTPCDISVSAWL